MEQVVAIKQLNQEGMQSSKEFLVEYLMLNMLHHQNLVNLIGCCAQEEERLLVYKYMENGSLQKPLLVKLLMFLLDISLVSLFCTSVNLSSL